MARKTKAEKKADEKFLKDMRERMDRSVDNEHEERIQGNADIRFINGDDQWEDSVKRDRKDRLMLTINKMPTFLDQIDGDIRQHKPGIKVAAVDNSGDDETADVIEGIIRYIERNSNAPRVYAYGGLHCAAGGRGAWRILTDYISEDSFKQTILIDRIANAYSVYFDPGAKRDDKQDGQYFFVVEDITKTDYERKYGEGEADFEVDGEELDNWDTGERVRIAEYFYRKEIGRETLYLLEDGTTVTELRRGQTAKKEREVVREEIWWCKADGKRILEGPQKVAGKMFPIVLCWGKQLCVDGKIDARGIARHAKDAQRLYNYFRTADAETVALQPKQPFLMPDVCLGAYKEVWDKSIDENYPYLPYHVDSQYPALAPNRQAPAMSSSGNVEQIQLAGQELYDTTGLQKAALGIQSNETSGVAINQRKIESDTGQFAFVDNISDAVRTTGKIIVGMIPEIFDTEEQIRILGKDMKEKIVRVNGLSGIDLTTGLYDVDVDSGPSYSTMRAEFVEKMGALLPSIPPEQTAVITDILFESMDMPRTDDIAARIKRTIPPEILGEDQDQQKNPMQGGQNPTQGSTPPPDGSAPLPPQQQQPVVDPMMEINLRIAVAKAEQEEAKAEQEKLKLGLMQTEGDIKVAGMSDVIRKSIEEIIQEGQEGNETAGMQPVPGQGPGNREIEPGY